MFSLLAVASYCFVTSKDDVAPQLVRDQRVASIKAHSNANLAPKTAVDSRPATTPVPVEDSSKNSTPVPAPAPALPQTDPIAWLCDHRERAPKQLVLRTPVIFAVTENHKESGKVEVPAGATAQIVDFTATTVDLRVVNATVRIPVDITNLRMLAQAAMEGRTPAAVASAEVQPMHVNSRTAVLSRRFAHPSAPLNLEDLKTLKANLDKEPWKSGYAALAADPHSRVGGRMSGPFAEVGRAPNVNLGPWRNDMTSIWCLARMWYFTGNKAYAQKAHDILIAWSTTHKVFSGREATLDLGDYAYKFVGGAEILRGTWPGWTEADTATVKNYFAKVLLPATNKYGENMYGAGNKGALSMVAAALMEIFNDDPAKLEATLWQYRALPHIGIRNSNPIGELGDSLRDQGHFHGQFLSLAMLAETLWKQGIDLYSEQDNRLLAVGEYFGRVNLQVPTPFLPFGTTDAYYTADNTNHGWDHGRMVLNLVHGAYVVRKGLQAPYVEMRRQQLPIDGESFMFEKVVDHSTALPLPALSFPGTASVTRGMHDVDIGRAGPAGTSSYSGGNWKVKGSGDPRHPDQSCHFTYKAVTGNCAIIAKVESIEDNSGNARSGVMLRASLDPNATRGLMLINKKGQAEQNFQGFSIYGGSNYGTKALGINQTSYWVKLERVGRILAGYISQDGTNWAATDVGQYNEMPETVYIGLAVCSGSSGALNSTTFTHVQITGGDDEAPATIPAPPVALLASPGEKSVPLRWQPSLGARWYLVKRATTSGGPYTTIAKATDYSYVDTSVTGGDNYYYVVSAVNSAGESANSPEDTVKPEGWRLR
ncbi:alginate lyase family protein [Chthoniobacter flavus]|uniref:alginate lyase family protein n=1 Tax=Chthoniobacter flavus TaxID=191863 RepID=UPI001A9F12E1|nr:alginate lyase family protein [Chthoniobacter flavus]